MELIINDKNYQEYKKVFEILWNQLMKELNNEIFKNLSPIKKLEEFEEKNLSIAKKGLKEGLRDTLIMIKGLPAEKKELIEKELKEYNLPNTRKLTGLLDKTTNKVLKRHHIKSLDEFYTIKEFVNDLSSDLTESERKELFDLLEKFETRENNKR